MPHVHTYQPCRMQQQHAHQFCGQTRVWRRTAFEEEDGKIQCPYAKNKVTHKRNIISNNKEQDKIYNDKKKDKTTGRVEEVPEYVIRFIEKDLRGRIVTTHPDGHCVRRAIGKIWNLHPGQVKQYLAKKCQKNVGPRNNHPVGKECRMVRKNSQQTKRMAREKKQCTQTMQTRRMGWVVRNKYLGDNHQNNNSGNKRR